MKIKHWKITLRKTQNAKSAKISCTEKKFLKTSISSLPMYTILVNWKSKLNF